MTDVVAQVSFASSTGLAKDQIVNTFHISGTDSASTIASAWSTYLQAFYNSVHTPGSTALAGFMSGDLTRSQALHSVKFYDLADPKPRAPIRLDNFYLGALSGTGANLPKEVAVCLSYKGTYASGIPQARQRGRIYHGPLNTNMLSGASTVNVTVDSSYINALKGGGAYLVGVGTSGAKWVVRSAVGGFSTYVTGGWVDNAFDTQRRRGLLPTTRNTW